MRPEQPTPPQQVKPDTQPIKLEKTSHKVATVRGKEEEKLFYGREFVGSGRISEYIMMQKLGEGTFGYAAVLFIRIITQFVQRGPPGTASRCFKGWRWRCCAEEDHHPQRKGGHAHHRATRDQDTQSTEPSQCC